METTTYNLIDPKTSEELAFKLLNRGWQGYNHLYYYHLIEIWEKGMDTLEVWDKMDSEYFVGLASTIDNIWCNMKTMPKIRFMPYEQKSVIMNICNKYFENERPPAQDYDGGYAVISMMLICIIGVVLFGIIAAISGIK